jgi:hypothetical protein
MKQQTGTEPRLIQLIFFDGKSLLGVVPSCQPSVEFPFIMHCMGRQWMMTSRGSGGPKSIPVYNECLEL